MRREGFAWCWFLLLGCLGLTGCQPEKGLVVYTSQDEVFARPVLDDYSMQVGYPVQALYDHESVKTAGLVRRLMAERDRPRCDVFWSNEALRTYQLLQEGVLDPQSNILEMGGRARVFICRSGGLEGANRPESLETLVLPEWKGRVVMAYPLFGTTCTHLLALRHEWGEERWQAWCQALLENEVRIVDGNSSVVRLVTAGLADLGITDTDDVQSALSEGKKIESWMFQESLVIPNTVAILAGAPHPERARAFQKHMGSAEVLNRLMEQGAVLQTVDSPDMEMGIRADWVVLARELKDGLTVLAQVFEGRERD